MDIFKLQKINRQIIKEIPTKETYKYIQVSSSCPLPTKTTHGASHTFQVILKRVGLLFPSITRSMTISVGEWNQYYEQSGTAAGSDVGMADLSASSQTAEVSCCNRRNSGDNRTTPLNVVCFLRVSTLSTVQFI